MTLSIQQLIKGQQNPTAISPYESVQTALEQMIKEDYTQLPVVDREGKAQGMVTSESILRALNHFCVTLESLRVSDAMVKAREFRADDDLFDLLNDLRDTYAVLVVDSDRKLVGIVTSYDTTEYFRRRAEDIMLVEDIENTLKDYISVAFTNEAGEIDLVRLSVAIEEITPSNHELKGKFRKALCSYLQYQGDSEAPNSEWVENVFSQHLHQKKQPKPFDELTLYEYTELFLHESRWDRYSSIFTLNTKAIRKLLDAVRKTRNDLAHFRGEISSQQRDKLRFCKDWLARHQSDVIAIFKIGSEEQNQVINVEAFNSNTPLVSTINGTLSIDEALSPDRSRYAPLALWLQSQMSGQNKLQLTFKEIEKLIGDDLPASARRHRAWWANDSVSHPQSQQWLNVGWRVATIDMTEERVIFTRIKEQEKAYIDFFSALLAELNELAEFTVNELSQDGRYLVTVKGIPDRSPPVANLTFTFITNYKKFRVELYIDKRKMEQNKRLFDKLAEHKSEIEAALGNPLDWERMDDRHSSRIALYHDGAITDSEEKLKELRKWAVDAMLQFHKVMEKKVSEVLSADSNGN